MSWIFFFYVPLSALQSYVHLVYFADQLSRRSHTYFGIFVCGYLQLMFNWKVVAQPHWLGMLKWIHRYQKRDTKENIKRERKKKIFFLIPWVVRLRAVSFLLQSHWWSTPEKTLLTLVRIRSLSKNSKDLREKADCKKNLSGTGPHDF